ncbi:hypothetical protein ABQ274_12675 [Lactococcus lactis]|uniref:hypothetical protein n=1 Tax=Lactococcus lactis TaxID=1358 RepID=UPI00338DCCF3
MSELEKAKQELEQVCFAYHKAGGTGDIKDWKYFYDLENKLIEKVKIANQPQLMIPKSIADWLDKAFEKYHDENSLASTTLSLCMIRDISKHDNIEKWFMHYNIDQLNLAIAYLAGKALGVDLVKVVEG